MADRPRYTEIEHTADVGITLRAPDLGAAFECAAAAAFDLMCDLDRVSSDLSFDLRVEGRPGDLEHLMVRWLSELLYLYNSERVLLSEFEVLELRGFVGDDGDANGSLGDHAAADGRLDTLREESGLTTLLLARVRGEMFDARRHHMKVELKAPTYHLLTVERDGGGWSVRVIFDT